MCSACNRSFVPPLLEYVAGESSKTRRVAKSAAKDATALEKLLSVVGGDNGLMITGALSGSLSGMLSGAVVGGWANAFPLVHPELPAWLPIQQEATLSIGGIVGGVIGGILAGFSLGVIVGACVSLARRPIEGVFELTPARVALLGGSLSGLVAAFLVGGYRWSTLGLLLGAMGSILWLALVIWAESHVPGFLESGPLGTKKITEDAETPAPAADIAVPENRNGIPMGLD
jgi:hypothetical protein